jgi:outer membrane receptor protein involved in Fe transport
MSNRAHLRLLLLSATAFTSVQLSAVQAQTAPASTDADSTLEEIVVTGTRRELLLQDAPINITAVTAEKLDQQRINDIKDLAAFTPGVTVLDTGPRSTGRIVLRGLSSNDANIGGSNQESAVATYLGEVPIYVDFKLLDIDRVEVLLGPQGTLYGAGTLAGAIRYLPKRPVFYEVEGYVHARVSLLDQSSDTGYIGDAAFNIPIVPGHVALRTVIGYFFEPGYIDYNYVLQTPGRSNPQPGAPAPRAGNRVGPTTLGTPEQQAANFSKNPDANFERTFTSRNTLLAQVNDNVKAYFTYAYQLTETDGFQANSGQILGTGRYENAARYLEPSRRETHLMSLELNINLFDFADLVTSSAITRQKITGQTDNTDLLIDLDYDYELFPNFSSFAPSTVKYRQFNQEIRLVSRHGGPLSWVVGGFYNEFKFSSRRDEYVPGYTAFAGITFRPDDLEFISFVNTKTTEKAIFGEFTYQITDAWQFTAGGRYFDYKAFAEGGTDLPLTGGGRRRTPFPLIVFDPSRVRSGNTSDDGFVWKLNTSYKFSDDFLAYFTWSKGYRIGGVNRVAPCILPLPPGQNLCALPDELVFGPDKTNNKELGIRFGLLDKRLTGNIAIYHIDWTGIQVASRTINGALGITRNAAEAESKGFELSLNARPIDQLVISATYTYNDANLTGTAPGVIVTQRNGRIDGRDGDRLPGTPKNSGSLGATYTLPMEFGGDFVFNWTATYRGNVVTRIGQRGFGEKLPGFTLHRASVTYAADTWEVSLFANNIFDKYAVASTGQTLEQRGFVNDGVVSRYYGQTVIRPRQVGLEARYRF